MPTVTPGKMRHLAACFADPFGHDARHVKGPAGYYCRILGWTAFVHLPPVDGRQGVFIVGAECITPAGLRILEAGQ